MLRSRTPQVLDPRKIARERTEAAPPNPAVPAPVAPPEPASRSPRGWNRVHVPAAPTAGPPAVSVAASARSDLGLFIHPGLTDACSISHVLRNLGVHLYQKQRLDVRWVQTDPRYKVSCPSYFGTTEQFMGRHTQPYATLTWGVEAQPLDAAERGRVMIATTDNSWVLREQPLSSFRAPNVGAILVLSPECKRVLAEAGVPEERLHLLPLGVDPHIYRPQGPADRPATSGGPQWFEQRQPEDGAFTFLCAGYMQPRKGCRETVEAFCRAFSGRRDVALVVKNVKEFWGKDESDALRRIMAEYDAPPVALIQSVLTEYQMAALLRGADCFVNAHRREGFGLMPLQAMACGTPVIVTDYHGPRQYATATNCYLLPTTGLEPAQDTSEPNPVDWATYDLDALAGLMQDAAAKTRRATIVKQGLAEAAKWTWRNGAETILETVESSIGYLRRRPRKWHSRTVEVSVVMPVRNAPAKLATTLRTLQECQPAAEVLVYDDASGHDEQAAIAEICAAYSACRLIRGEEQLGCHGARAILFEQARGAFIASIDADMDFTNTSPEWMEMLADLWRKRGRGIMHPLLVYPDGHPDHGGKIHSAGSYVRGGIMGFDHRFNLRPRRTSGVKRAVPVACCCGAFQFFHQSLLDELNQDAVYWPAYFGDADFAYRARAAGYPVWYCPEVTVGHDANSWGLSDEGRKLARWAETSERFHKRWADMMEEDKLRQDETGALV